MKLGKPILTVDGIVMIKASFVCDTTLSVYNTVDSVDVFSLHYALIVV